MGITTGTGLAYCKSYGVSMAASIAGSGMAGMAGIAGIAGMASMGSGHGHRLARAWPST